MPDFHVHWVTIAGGTAAYFALGAIWYGVLAAPWMRALGTTRDEIKAQEAGWVYGVQLVATFAMVVLATWILHDWGGVDDFGSGVLGGLALGVVAVLAGSGDFLYESRRRSMPLFLINSGYRLVGLVVVGAIVGLLD